MVKRGENEEKALTDGRMIGTPTRGTRAVSNLPIIVNKNKTKAGGRGRGGMVVIG